MKTCIIRLLPLGAPFFLIGCSDMHSVLTPYGPRATEIAQLAWFLFALAAIVMAIVMASLAFALRGSGAMRARLAQRSTVMIGGIIFPAITLTGLLGYGVYQLYNAYRAKLSKQLELGSMSDGIRRALIGVSRFGIAARGIVFGTIAVLMYRAARDHDPSEAGGLGDSMRELLVNLGRWPYLAIALGVGAYGVYELINAKYRRIKV